MIQNTLKAISLFTEMHCFRLFKVPLIVLVILKETVAKKQIWIFLLKYPKLHLNIELTNKTL